MKAPALTGYVGDAQGKYYLVELGVSFCVFRSWAPQAAASLLKGQLREDISAQLVLALLTDLRCPNLSDRLRRKLLRTSPAPKTVSEKRGVTKFGVSGPFSLGILRGEDDKKANFSKFWRVGGGDPELAVVITFKRPASAL